MNGGDSGSAVFLWGGGSNVTLTGQLFGGRTDNTHFIFSPWNNIQGIMGNIVTTPYGYRARRGSRFRRSFFTWGQYASSLSDCSARAHSDGVLCKRSIITLGGCRYDGGKH